jgi:D-alanine-D-alanine ligase
MHFGLTYDLRRDYLAEGFSAEATAEFDADETIDALAATIAACGHTVTRIGHGRALAQRLVAGERWDMVFTIAEGMYGRAREAQVPALLELYNIPYVGSDPLVCAATLDKAVAKTLVRAAGVRTPAFAVVRSVADIAGVHLQFPLFVKPVAEGTGKGISRVSRVTDAAHLRQICLELLGQFQQPVLIEEFLPGREFTVGIVGTGAQARVIGLMEIVFFNAAAGTIYSYDVKETWEQHVRYAVPAPGALRADVEATARGAFRALECRDMARVDVRLDGQGQAHFIEVNPLPGLHPGHSDLPILAGLNGITYPALLGAILDSACARLPAP